MTENVLEVEKLIISGMESICTIVVPSGGVVNSQNGCFNFNDCFNFKDRFCIHFLCNLIHYCHFVAHSYGADGGYSCTFSCGMAGP
jgi:hypothetical protein